MVMKMYKKYHGVMPPPKAVIKDNFEVFTSTQVDDECWYTVQVIPRVSTWIREQPNELWYNHITPSQYKVLDTFDINEKLYLLMVLKWA